MLADALARKQSIKAIQQISTVYIQYLSMQYTQITKTQVNPYLWTQHPSCHQLLTKIRSPEHTTPAITGVTDAVAKTATRVSVREDTSQKRVDGCIDPDLNESFLLMLSS